MTTDHAKATLDDQLRAAVDACNAMDPVDRALMMDDQRRSLVRSGVGSDPGESVLAAEVRRLRALQAGPAAKATVEGALDEGAVEALALVISKGSDTDVGEWDDCLIMARGILEAGYALHPAHPAPSLAPKADGEGLRERVARELCRQAHAGPYSPDAWVQSQVDRLWKVHGDHADAILALTSGAGGGMSLQSRVAPWMQACFGPEISRDVRERGDRFLEEALELLQAHGYDQSRVATLVDYVYGRPVGEPYQEVGGVMITLAAYCLATGVDMHEAGDRELARIWTKVEQIRAKQASKRGLHTPLPSPPTAGGSAS